MVGVHGPAGELAGELRIPRVPVMTIGDDQKVEVPHLVSLGAQLPPTTGQPARMLDSVAELDGSIQAEGRTVVVEILLDLGVVRKVGELFGHREIAERQLMFRGVDMQ